MHTTTDPTVSCSRCGMVANRDPWLHADRYGHQPEFIDEDGHLRRHAGDGSFPVVTP